MSKVAMMHAPEFGSLPSSDPVRISPRTLVQLESLQGYRSCGVVTMILHLATLTQYRRHASDRHTQRQAGRRLGSRAPTVKL